MAAYYLSPGMVEFLGYLDIPSAPEISQEATKNSPTYVHSFP